MFIEGGTTPSRHQLYDSRDTSGSHHPDLPMSPSQAHFQLSHTKKYPAQKILAAWFLDIFVQINALEKTYPGSSPILKFLFLMYSFLSLSNLAAFFFFFFPSPVLLLTAFSAVTHSNFSNFLPPFILWTKHFSAPQVSSLILQSLMSESLFDPVGDLS